MIQHTGFGKKYFDPLITQRKWSKTLLLTLTSIRVFKDLNDLDKHDGVGTHLEPDILKCEVKWALGSITMNKATEGDGIPAELFQILKDDAVKLWHSTCQQIWKTELWPQDWKRSVFIPIPKKSNSKECSNYHTIVLISHATKVSESEGRLVLSSSLRPHGL